MKVGISPFVSMMAHAASREDNSASGSCRDCSKLTLMISIIILIFRNKIRSNINLMCQASDPHMRDDSA